MAEIHIHTPEGETVIHTEERIAELLKSGVLTPETLYWREGMPEWLPLAKLRMTRSQVILPERRTTALPPFSTHHPLPLAETLAATPPAPPVDPKTHATGRRRFRFRKPPEPLTTIVQVLLVVCMAVAVLELANGLVHYNALSTQMPQFAHHPDLFPAQDGSAPAGADTTTSSLDTSPTGTDVATLVPQEADDMGQFLEYLGWAVNIALVVPYLMWLYRTSQNCRHFSQIMRFKPAWTVGCYFVPVINFFRPCQMMQEIWRVSRNPRTWHNDRFSPLVAVWWTLTLLTGAVSIYSFFHSVDAMSHDQQLDAQVVYLGLKVLQVATYGVFLGLVTKIIHMQMEAVRKSKSKSDPGDADDEE